MTFQIITALAGAIGFVVAAGAALQHIRRSARWAPSVLRLVALCAVVLNGVFIIRQIQEYTVVETLRHAFESTLLLAGLIGIVGLVTEMTRTLRGLDMVLFAVAALVQLASLTVLDRAGEAIDYKPWFISHGLAFAISATCFIAGGVAGIAYLVIHHRLRTKRVVGLVGRVASLEALEKFGRWMTLIGFPIFTYGILTGMCQVAHDKPAAVWFTDPFIVLVILIWLIYAAGALLIWFRPQFRGRRAAAIATCGMGLVVVVFLGAGVISTVHG